MTWLSDDILNNVEQASTLFFAFIHCLNWGTEDQAIQELAQFQVLMIKKVGYSVKLSSSHSPSTTVIQHHKHRNIVQELDHAYDLPFEQQLEQQIEQEISQTFEKEQHQDRYVHLPRPDDHMSGDDRLYDECLTKCRYWNERLKQIFLDTKVSLGMRLGTT